MQTNRFTARSLLVGAIAGTFCLCLAATAAVDRPPPGPPLDLDLPACQSFHDRQPSPAPAANVASVLGLDNRGTAWTAGRLADEQSSDVFRYRLAFRREIAIGTIVADTTAQEVCVLRADAPYPGDPWNPSHWTSVAVPPRQLELCAVPMPSGVKTRAVLLVDRRQRWPRSSELRYLRLMPGRFFNVTPLAAAYADREYTPPNTSFVPEPASNLPAGKGRWVNTGKNHVGLYSAPPVSDVHPSWFLLGWRGQQAIAGLVLRSNIEKFELHAFAGPPEINPRAGAPEEWRKIRQFDEQTVSVGSKENIRSIRFREPIATRGLRITILKSAEGPVAAIDGIQTLVNLNDRAVPEPELPSDPQPPFHVAYELPEDGILTLAINDSAGRRVRNLVTRAAQLKGSGNAPWDLKDDEGNFVSPGSYRWTALACPELRLRYETTLYPNIPAHAPGNSPWLNGPDGSGGWLADHTPPVGVCAAGDRVYLSAPCAESGVSLIECDLEGRKLWGHNSFAAWTGPRLLASDGKQVFAAAQILNTTSDCVWTVDMATKKVGNLLTLLPTARRRRGMEGMAVCGGKLYLSVRGPETWLENAAAAEDVDPLACLPSYRKKREARVAHEVVPDPRNDFLRLFRLAPYPPGGETQQSLTYLETMGGPRRRQHVVLAFKKPVPLGSVVYPVPQEKGLRVVLSVLKKDAPLPPRADDPADWMPFQTQGKQLWDAVAAPEGTLTRALRITFSRGDEGDDLGGNLLDVTNPSTAGKVAGTGHHAGTVAKAGEDTADGTRSVPATLERLEPGEPDLGASQGSWTGRLEGMKLLRRRFVNVAGEATVRFNSGGLLPDGTWDARRTEPLSESNPGIYAIQWKTEQAIRGLAIKEVDGALTKIDVFTGKPEGPLDIAGADGWQEVAQYQQQRRDVGNGFGLGVMNSAARYVDGYVDFGREIKTRAVRLRVVQQWADKGQAGCMGIRMDLGGPTLDAKRCRVFGVAALQYLGGEVPVDPLSNERIEVYDTRNGSLLDEIPIAQPGPLAAGAGGELLALAGGNLVRVDPAGKAHQTLVSDLQSPTSLAADRQGLLYVFDRGKDRQNLRVYDHAGKYLRSIGTPGGFQVGPWDPTRMGAVSSIDIDSRGQLWVVENQYWPKRVTLWSTDGTLKREFLGNTAYGGGGVLDPEDKTRLFYGPLEFAIDWQTGASRLKNLTLGPGWSDLATAGEVPFRAGGRTYLVNRANFLDMHCGVVYLYEKDHLRPVAAMGLALYFDPLKRPEVLSRLSNNLADQKFIWCDRNGDGQVQADEVILSPKPADMHGLTNFNRDLGVQAGNLRYQVREFLPNGAPVYEEHAMPALHGECLYRLDDGNFYRMGNGEATDTKVDPEGRKIWSVPQEGWGGHALHHAKPFRPDQVVAQLGMVGHETAHAGGLGEFVVNHSNPGAWHIWTADGLLAGPIFRDERDPKAEPWSMTAHQRGMILENITTGEEHFQGYFCRTADNHYYVVAGHNHISILEVLGLEQCRRLGGELTITSEEVRKAQQWETRRQHEEVYQRAPVVDVYRLRKPPEMDGKLDDWGPPDAEIPEGAELRLGYDDVNLYVACSTRSLGPLINKGHEWDRLFKTGAAVDLQIGTSAAASEDRKMPQPGDVRLLMTVVDQRPVAVLYRPVVPGTPPEKVWRVVSPVGETTIDEVKRLEGVRMARSGGPNQYILQAAVPLAALGLKPEPGLRLKLDWGVLVSGPSGSEVLRRVTWANHASQIVADAPSEARLQPNLWGHARFHDYRPSAEEELGELRWPADKNASKKIQKDVIESLEESPPAGKR